MSNDHERLSEAVRVINDVLAQPATDPVRPDDDGDLYVAVSVKDNMLFLDFGHAVTWISLPKPELEAFIELLERHRDKLT